MRFALIISFFLFSFASFAQQKTTYDSSIVEQRSFTDSSLSTYKKDRDFQYERERTQAPSFWTRFWIWFWNKYDQIMSTKTGRITMNIIYWLIGIGAVVFFVVKVTRMNRMALFTSSEENTAYTVEQEDIHVISFEAAIENALQNGNYRLAIRLLYLQNLKILSDKNLITWQPNKTNTEYVTEIKPDLQQLFKKITNVFEYVWYGSHAITKDDFSVMRNEFNVFQQQLSAK